MLDRCDDVVPYNERWLCLAATLSCAEYQNEKENKNGQRKTARNLCGSESKIAGSQMASDR